jgi:hypothetical protein
MVGVLEHDLAKLLLRSDHADEAEIAKHLARAQAQLHEAGNRGMLAGVHMAWATLHHREARQAEQGGDRTLWLARRSQVDAAIESALAILDDEPSPMLRTNFYIDAASLHHSGLGSAYDESMDAQRLRLAANYCTIFGYGGQARQLLALPSIERVLPEATIATLEHLRRADDSARKRER